jgi:hypothetical protein
MIDYSVSTLLNTKQSSKKGIPKHVSADSIDHGFIKLFITNAERKATPVQQHISTELYLKVVG